VREKDKYLVRWKEFTVESDTWEERENLKNAKEAIEEFEREYRQDIEDIVKQEREKGTFRRGELPGRCKGTTLRMLRSHSRVRVS